MVTWQGWIGTHGHHRFIRFAISRRFRGQSFEFNARCKAHTKHNWKGRLDKDGLFYSWPTATRIDSCFTNWKEDSPVGLLEQGLHFQSRIEWKTFKTNRGYVCSKRKFQLPNAPFCACPANVKKAFDFLRQSSSFAFSMTRAANLNPHAISHRA